MVQAALVKPDEKKIIIPNENLTRHDFNLIGLVTNVSRCGF